MFQTLVVPEKYIPLLRSLRNILSRGAINIAFLRDCAEEKSCTKNKNLRTCHTENAETKQRKPVSRSMPPSARSLSVMRLIQKHFWNTTSS